MIKRKAQKFIGFMTAIAMTLGSTVALKPAPTEASVKTNISSVAASEFIIAPTTVLRAGSTELISATAVKSVPGRTYNITIKQTKRKWDSDFDKGTVLGYVQMTTKIYYGGENTDGFCPGYVECNITVNPNIVKRNNDRSINKVGVPQNIVVEGNFKMDNNQAAYPIKVNGEYQLSSSHEVGYTVNGGINLGWSKKDGFGVSGTISSGRQKVTTTSVSYPAKLITYGVIDKTGAEGNAHWEHKYSLSYINSQKAEKVKTDMLYEVTSTNKLYAGLAGKLKTYYVTTSDYIASGYKKYPGYYVDWDSSQVLFNVSASFGGVRDSLKEIYAYELGSKTNGFVRVK